MTEQKQSVRVGFTGDVTFTKYFGNGTEPAFYLSPKIQSFLAETDHCVCNVEGPITGREKSRKSNFLHSSAPEMGKYLPRLGMDIWNLANNHMLDFGAEGLQDTLKTAAALGCTTIGAGETAEQAAAPCVIEAGGGIGILGISYAPNKPAPGTEACCFHWDDEARIAGAIRGIKERCRWCVLVIHGGNEFAGMPMNYTRSRYLKYLQLGADIIVGHHPHVVQNYERLGQKMIFYSLGNFIFDTDYQRSQKHTELGILLKLRLDPEHMDWEYLPVRIDRNTGRIEACEKPAIFTELSEQDYNELIPCGAGALLRAERQRDAFLHPEKYRNYSAWKWALRELYRCRNSRILKLNLAALRAGRKIKDERLKQVKAYLLNQGQEEEK